MTLGGISSPEVDVRWKLVLLVAVGVALTDTIVRWVVAAVIGLWIHPLGSVVVAAAIVVGKPTRWGSVVGLLVVGSLLGDWSGRIVGAVAAFTTAAVTTRLWARETETNDGGWVAWTVRYGIAAGGGVFVFVATGAWISDVIGREAFSVVVPTLLSNLPLAVVGAPLVYVALERTAGTGWRRPGRPLTATRRTLILVIVLCWLVGGYVCSFLFRALERAPPGALGRRVSPTFEAFVALWGQQGTVAQLVLGIGSLAVIVFLLRR